MTVPGKLTVGKDGKLTGPASIEYNHPWPCVNGRNHVTGTMRGVVMHTMVGNLPGTTTSLPVQWLPAYTAITFDVAVTVAPSSAPVCYGATSPSIKDTP